MSCTPSPTCSPGTATALTWTSRLLCCSATSYNQGMDRASATFLFDKWPDLLMIARHGYSFANRRKDEAKAAGVEPSWTERERDQDSPLTDIGHQQAFDLGVMIGMSDDDLPEIIVTSPYLRAKQTTEGVVRWINSVRNFTTAYAPRIVVEERVREIEFGTMDGIDRSTFRRLF